MLIVSPLSFLLLCFLVGYFWHHKGRSFLAGFFTSIVGTPILGMIVGMALRSRPARVPFEYPPTAQYKRCTGCGEQNRKAAQRCRFCGVEFSDRLYEVFCRRLQTADRIRENLVLQYGRTAQRLDERLKAVEYELFGVSESLRQQARTYSPGQLRQVLDAFPPKKVFDQKMKSVARQWGQQIECPACGHLQSKEHLLCETCYADLKQVNPDTGEIEPIRK